MLITDFTPLIEAIEASDSKTLVVFDVDETLIVAKDKILRPCGEKHLLSIASQSHTELSQEHLNELRSLALLQREICHTDPQLNTLFTKIHQKKLPTIALTALPTGKFGVIQSLEEWRDEELKRHGIDFTKSTPYQETLYFNEFGNEPPLFYKGMLFSIDYSKGAVLKAFLQKTQLIPTKVIFVEDRHPHILTVQEELESISIPSQCFHYVGASRPEEEISKEIVHIQFTNLVKNRKWLSDSEALALIK